MKKILLLLVVLAFCLATAQESPSYKLDEGVFSLGGNPLRGAILASASYRMTLDSLGEGAVSVGLGSTSYLMDASFALRYPPPGEVMHLRFPDRETLNWDPERSIGVYHLYRDDVCEQPDLPGVSASVSESPGAGALYSYLVTAENRLAEEGTKGYRSDGSERPNEDTCP